MHIGVTMVDQDNNKHAYYDVYASQCMWVLGVVCSNFARPSSFGNIVFHPFGISGKVIIYDLCTDYNISKRGMHAYRNIIAGASDD